MKALVLNAAGRWFDFENGDIVRASGLCHTDLLFAAHEIVHTPALLGHKVVEIVDAVGPEVKQLHIGDHLVGSLARRAEPDSNTPASAANMANTALRRFLSQRPSLNDCYREE